MIEITIVKIHRLPSGSRLQAFANIVVNGALVIKGVRIVRGRDGLFVSMPQERGQDQRFYDIVQCLNQEAQDCVTVAVLSAYKKTITEGAI